MGYPTNRKGAGREPCLVSLSTLTGMQVPQALLMPIVPGTIPNASHRSQCLLLVLVWQQMASYWSASHTMRMM